MKMKIETTDAQNRVANIRANIYLNVVDPTTKMKRQFAAVEKAFLALHLELDLLNDMKEE
jgi:hypothetical protein